MDISVIVPTYQPGTYIYECLDSLAKQTFSSTRYEVILVLNGCREPYLSNLRKYIQHEMAGVNVNLLQTDVAGVSNARNIALDIVRGDYVTFIDDDDYISPTYLEELYKKATPEIISLSYAKAFNDYTGMMFSYSITFEYEQKARFGMQLYYKVRRYFSGPCMKLIHRNIISDRRFDVRYKNGEDSLFLFLISDKIRMVDFTSENAIYFRRYRKNSAMTVHRSLLSKISNSLNLICSYSSIYFHNVRHYSFYFYATRILATIKSVFSVLRVR